MEKEYLKGTVQKKQRVNYYPLPLLVQGSAPLRVLSGAIQELIFNTETGRGDIYALNVFNSFPVIYPPYPVSGTGGQLSLIAGGQNIFQDVSADSFAALPSPGNFVRAYTPVNLGASQNIRLIGDATATSAGANLVLQTLIYYTNNEHQKFVKAYKRKSNLGAKRQSFRLRVNNNTSGVFTLPGVVPKFQGVVTGVQIQLAKGDAFDTDIRDGRLTLDFAVNGVNIIQNVNAQYFALQSMQRPQFFPVLIEPASTFLLTANLTTGVLNDDLDIFLTFYFDN
jgi:hypothetical protein